MAFRRLNDSGASLRNPLYGYMVHSCWGQVLALSTMVLFFSLFSRKFFTLSNAANILRQISTNSILAFGMTFVVLTGGIDLSIGAISALSSCIVASLLERECPTALAIAAAIAMGCFFGLFNGMIVTLSKIPAFIATMSSAIIGRGIASLFANGKSIMVTDEAFIEISNGSVGPVSNLILFLLLFYVISALLMYMTRFGRNVFAIGDNRETARLVGIRIARTERRVYILSGCFASVVGVLLSARMYSGQPLIGDGSELDAVAAVVIGGTSLSGGFGTLIGTLLGAMILGVMNNGLNLLKVQSYWQQIFKGVLIISAACLDFSRPERH